MRRLELRKRIPDLHARLLPIVEPGALEGFVVDGKAERPHEVKCGVGGEAKPGDVAGIGRDFRLDEDDIEHGKLSFLFPLRAKFFRTRGVIVSEGGA